MIQNELKQHEKSWNKFTGCLREMQFLEEENDTNMQQKFNNSTCSVCNKDATDKYISCSECHIQIHYRCTFLPSHQLYYFVEKKRKYTCVNCTPARSFKNQFKNQLLEEHQSNSFHLRSSNDAISPILERLITQLRDEVVTLKNQLDRKDKIIDNLLEKIENKVSKDVTPQCGNSRIKPKLTDKCVNCDLLSTSKEEQTKNNMSNKDSNTISLSTETVRANTVDKEKPSPHMESENPAATPENNKQNKTNASQITSNQIDENRNQKLKKTAVILGDSMVKHINGWEMEKKVNTDCKVFVKSFSGATTQCMVDYMKPSIRTQPDHFILHVGTNDLTSNSPSDEIARNIINLASEMKSEKSDVSISTIITRADKPELNKKGIEVNNHLKEMCKEKNIFIIDNSKRIKPNHLNSSKIHLNKKGDKILGNIFTQHLSKVFN